MSDTTTRPIDRTQMQVSDEVAIDIRNMNKWYGSFHVLRDIDLTVHRGERIVIAGPSGSGKSTLIRCINRLEEHQSGHIVVDGIELTNDIKNIDKVRSEVGMVFQHFNLFPHLTVLENCTLAPIWVRKVPRRQAEETAMRFLEKVKIPEQANKYPGQLSGGQQQRVALARALVGRPRVLLLDEPLGALDLKLREQMQVELKAIQREVGITFVIVTHDQDEALTLCDRLVVLNDGRIEQIGAARDVYENPANRFVADFVGTSNVLDGEAADAVLGTRGTFAIRPERIEVLDRGAAVPAAHRAVDAEVAEVVYAGPTTRIAATVTGAAGLSSPVRLTATLLSAEASTAIAHGTPIVLAWPDAAVLDLTDERSEGVGP